MTPAAQPTPRALSAFRRAVPRAGLLPGNVLSPQSALPLVRGELRRPGALALTTAQKIVGFVPPEKLVEFPFLEEMLPTLLFTQARFGRWDDILAAPPPPADAHYATGMWHYARRRDAHRVGVLRGECVNAPARAAAAWTLCIAFSIWGLAWESANGVSVCVFTGLPLQC